MVVRVCGKEFVSRYETIPVLWSLFELEKQQCLVSKLPIDELVEHLLSLIIECYDDVMMCEEV